MSSSDFEFDPLVEATRRDPFPFYSRARREFPVYYHKGLPLVSLFRYTDVLEALKNADTWSSNYAPLLQPYLAASPELAAEMPPFFSALDGEPHRRIQSLVNKAYTPKLMRALEPALRRSVSELLDHALQKREVDLIQDLAAPLPLRVIGDLIGIPPQDSHKFEERCREFVDCQFQGAFKPPSREMIDRQISATRALHDYFREIADQRKVEPREDMISALVSVEENDQRLSYPEVLQTLTLLLIAGNMTTIALIGNMVVELATHPDQMERLRADRSLVPSAVDEVLRFASPIQAMPRLSTRVVEVHGRRIERGQFGLMWLGSANRDEAVFDRPAEFDVGRTSNPHIAFGFGAHSCIGQYLSTLEARVVLSALLERTRSFEITSEGPLPIHSAFVARCYRQLPVRLLPS